MVDHRTPAPWAIAAVLALAACSRPPPMPEGKADPALAGDWSGVMPFPASQHIVLHVRRTADGGAETTLDVPERDLAGYPVVGPVHAGANVDFAIPQVRFRYQAMLDGDGRTMRGTVTQGAAPKLDVTLRRSGSRG